MISNIIYARLVKKLREVQNRCIQSIKLQMFDLYNTNTEMSFKDTLWDGALKLGGMAYNYIKENNADKNMQNSPIANTLKQKLGFCTYDKNLVPDIIQFSMEFFKHYPSAQIQTQTFDQGYNKSITLEYKIVVQVYKEDRKYPVECRVLIPKHFPNQPPILRIINVDVNRFETNSFYEQSTQKVEGNSYILNPLLISVKSWSRYNSKIIDVVNDGISIMSSHFPFYKKSQASTNTGFGFGPTNPNYQGNQGNQNQGWNQMPSTGNNNYNNNNNNNPFSGNNNNSWGFDNNVFNKPSQWQQEQPKVSQNTNQNSNWFSTKQLNPQQQRVKEDIEVYITQAISLKQQVQLMVKCNNITQKEYDDIQTSSIIDQILSKQINKITKSINKMKELLVTSEKLELQNVKLIDLVQPAGGTVQLLDLIAENKAQHDMGIFLENKFASNEINLETFLKHIRKVEEEKFMTKYMIKKVVEAMKHQ